MDDSASGEGSHADQRPTRRRAPPASRSGWLALLAAALLAGCQAPRLPSSGEVEIPAGRALVLNGLAPGGDLLVALDDAPERCRAPQVWTLQGSAWREVATGAPLAGSTCPSVTARLAADGRTLAVFDYSAGRASVLEIVGDAVRAAGAATLASSLGPRFPPPGPNLALSGDGRLLLLGASNRACDRGVGGGLTCGVAELFQRDGADWRSRAVLRVPDTERSGVRFGQAVALSPDGRLALVGGTGQPGRSGKLWLFSVREAAAPREIGAIAPDRVDGWFANDLALSGDGRRLAVGGERAVYLYRRENEAFVLHQRLTASDPAAGHFGERVALSTDGGTLLVAAPRTACTAGERCGAAYLYRLNEAATLLATVRPAAERADANFSHRVAVSADGRRFAVQGTMLHLFARP